MQTRSTGLPCIMFYEDPALNKNFKQTLSKEAWKQKKRFLLQYDEKRQTNRAINTKPHGKPCLKRTASFAHKVHSPVYFLCMKIQH